MRENEVSAEPGNMSSTSLLTAVSAMLLNRGDKSCDLLKKCSLMVSKQSMFPETEERISSRETLGESLV